MQGNDDAPDFMVEAEKILLHPEAQRDKRRGSAEGRDSAEGRQRRGTA
jgi:hypothetical protein